MRTPMNAKPPIPGDQPRVCWKTMGNAPKSIYRGGEVSFLGNEVFNTKWPLT